MEDDMRTSGSNHPRCAPVAQFCDVFRSALEIVSWFRLQRGDVDRYIALRLTQKHVSKQTVANEISLLDAVLTRAAVAWNCLRTNPLNFVQPLRPALRPMQFLTPYEVRQFLQHVDPEFYPFFLRRC